MKKSIFLLLAACLTSVAIQAQTCLPNEFVYKVKMKVLPIPNWKKLPNS